MSAAAFADQIQRSLFSALMRAYDPHGPEAQRHAAECAAYQRESDRWWADLQLALRERDRWADDGGAQP
jgi:hypothetical protein